MALNNSVEALNGESPSLYHKTRCVKRMKGLQHSSPSWDTLVVIAEFWRDRRCCGKTKTTNIKYVLRISFGGRFNWAKTIVFIVLHGILSPWKWRLYSFVVSTNLNVSDRSCVKGADPLGAQWQSRFNGKVSRCHRSGRCCVKFNSFNFNSGRRGRPRYFSVKLKKIITAMPVWLAWSQKRLHMKRQNKLLKFQWNVKFGLTSVYQVQV